MRGQFMQGAHLSTHDTDALSAFFSVRAAAAQVSKRG